MSSLKFKGRTVIVTGGSKGLGFGISTAFLDEGARVIVGARNAPAELPRARAQSDQGSALFFGVDVRDAEASQKLVDYAIKETGRLDILINNAGGSPEAKAASASPRFTQAIINLNLIAPAVLSQQCYQAIMATSGKGAIVNIASVSAVRPSPGTAAYGAAKAGLLNLTASLAQEWAPAVRVNAIISGLAKTENAFDHYGGEQGIARIEERMPMQRMALPEDIGRACLYLASDEASYISGATLAVDGGGEPPAFLSLKD